MNAVEHNRRTQPSESRRTGHGDAFVRVLDDGPGIPAIERAVVFDDEAITTSARERTRHRPARWDAEAAGGGIESTEPTGGRPSHRLRGRCPMTCDAG